MAGHFGRHLLKTQPEVEKFAQFRENLIKHYKMNARSAGMALLFLGAIPFALTYVGYKYQNINLVSAKRDVNPYHAQNNWVPRS
ncbi:hypothetical protein DAMA08_034640 [Martiniozyma asiatica (nom. inval.)]|nr:hypothetical protein DAMA08_034640 [Martiniozyma asiatica]